MFKLEKYFAPRQRLYQQSVKGRFRNIKWFLNFIFLSIYCFSPFLRFERGENTPSQAIFIDMAHGKAYFFFIEIWPQEVIYLAGILVMAALMLFFVTSLFGRIWCGYACFQTVWTDIFIALEKVFQGDRNQRLILDRKNSFKKFYTKTLTHLSWILVSLFTGFTFVCYFNDAIELSKSLFLNGEIGLSQVGWIVGIAAATYVMAGFAREHVCTFMCPYARFQSVMFDDNTLIITYDEKRGEARGKLAKEERKFLQDNKAVEKIQSFENRGDCIDCKQCVVVCPTGIDIRNGLQMECIACGLCIDACDEVMEKVGLPKGLIRYDTFKHLKDPDPKHKFRFFRARTLFYATILLLIGSLILGGLLSRKTLEVRTISDRNPLFVVLSDGSIRNGYTLKILNKEHQEKKFTITISQPNQALMRYRSNDLTEIKNISVKANDVGSFKIYVILPKELAEKNQEGRTLIKFLIRDQESGKEINESAVFIFSDVR